MPTTPIRRVRTVFTGVDGSPYYSNGYFSAAAGEGQDCIDAWHLFNAGTLTSTTGGFPVGGLITTEAEIQVVDPVTGNATGVEVGSQYATAGSATVDQNPAATQGLARWRTGAYSSGREIRGRTFMPGTFIANNTPAGKPNTTYVNSRQGRVDGLLANGLCEFVIWSRKNGLYEVVVGGSIWNEWAVLRSRRD